MWNRKTKEKHFSLFFPMQLWLNYTHGHRSGYPSVKIERLFVLYERSWLMVYAKPTLIFLNLQNVFIILLSHTHADIYTHMHDLKPVNVC